MEEEGFNFDVGGTLFWRVVVYADSVVHSCCGVGSIASSPIRFSASGSEPQDCLSLYCTKQASFRNGLGCILSGTVFFFFFNLIYASVCVCVWNL